MVETIDEYFAKGCGRCPRFGTPDCSTQKWVQGLRQLQELCLEQGLRESLKWGHPCYTYQDRNVAILGAFVADFRLTFFDASLFDDRHGLLEKQGPNSAHPSTIRFANSQQVATRRAEIVELFQQALSNVEAGRKPVKQKTELVLPAELVQALASDFELNQAFEALTPGRQRSYVIHLDGAKTSSTRLARIAKFREHVIAGKGFNER